ncbi:MAG: PAS domain-containing protein [Verrucomicrobia bacterium]|nr:PAS domain-containing protein [Verrucomicrobiota bacterium]
MVALNDFDLDPLPGVGAPGPAASLPTSLEYRNGAAPAGAHHLSEHLDAGGPETVAELQHLLRERQEVIVRLQAEAAALRRERAELQLSNDLIHQREEQASLLAQVATNTDHAVVVTNAAGGIEWVNAAFTRTTGFTLAEARGQRPGPLLQGAATNPQTAHFMREQVARGVAFETEVLNYRKDGSQYWMHVEVQPIHDEAGRLSNFIAVERDVSRQRQEAERQRLQAAVYRATAQSDSAAEGLRRILRLLGESLGWTFAAYWAPAVGQPALVAEEVWLAQPVARQEIERATQGHSCQFEEGAVGRAWRTREPVWVEVVATETSDRRAAAAMGAGLHSVFALPLGPLGGEVLGVLEFRANHIPPPEADLLRLLTNLGRQIGQFIGRQRARELLVEHEQRLSLVLEAAGLDYWDLDLRTQHVRSSPGWLRSLGYRLDGPGRLPTMDELRHPEDGPRAEAALRSHLEGRTPEYQVTQRLRALDGTWHWFQLRGRVVGRDASGRPTRVAGASLETAESGPLEIAPPEARKAARAAQRAVQAEFSQQVQHRLDDLLEATAALRRSPHDEAQRVGLEAVGTQAGALVEMLQDALLYGQLQSSQLPLQVADGSLRRVLDDVLTMMAPRARQKRLELAGLLEADVPEHLPMDEGRLHQVLTCLIQHAIDSTAAGEILVRGQCVERSGRRALRWTVRDTGHDRPADAPPGFFRPFAATGGTGLGLAIARGLVELMQGTIGLEGVPGGGATAWFELPLPADLQASQVAFDLGLAGARVLVADAHPVVGEACRGMLEPFGIQCTWVKDAAELCEELALSATSDRPYLAVLLDSELPGQPAAECAAQARKHFAAEARPHFLLLSPCGSPPPVAPGEDFDTVLAKPLQQGLLVDALLPATASGAVRAQSSTAPHVLVVEDHPINRSVAARLLRGLGCEPEFVDPGDAALQALDTTAYDLVLLHCQRPSCDVCLTAREIRRRERLGLYHSRPRLRMVALTAPDFEGEAERCPEPVMDDYLILPAKKEGLGRILETAFSPGATLAAEAEAAAGQEMPRAVVQLVHELSAKAVSALLRTFLRESPGKLADLSAQAGETERTSFIRTARYLAESSRVFGLAALGQAALEIGALAGGGAPSAVLRLGAQRLREAFSLARPELEKLQCQADLLASSDPVPA